MYVFRRTCCVALCVTSVLAHERTRVAVCVQEKLLCSILPQTTAQDLKSDLLSVETLSGAHVKPYMQRHNDVRSVHVLNAHCVF